MSVTTAEEEDLLEEITPELKKIDLLIKRNLQLQLQPINNSINSLLKQLKQRQQKNIKNGWIKWRMYSLITTLFCMVSLNLPPGIPRG